MPGLLVYAFYLFPYFLLDQAFFLLKGVFPDRPKVWYGSLSIELKKIYIKIYIKLKLYEMKIQYIFKLLGLKEYNYIKLKKIKHKLI